jgi:ABC-type bacteriocin/lantibiotic exporter with double-glycine peptidase domain
MKYHSVLQHSEEDCGAACLATGSESASLDFNLSDQSLFIFENGRFE